MLGHPWWRALVVTLHGPARHQPAVQRTSMYQLSLASVNASLCHTICCHLYLPASSMLKDTNHFTRRLPHCRTPYRRCNVAAANHPT